MNILGRDIKIDWGYKPRTVQALSWSQKSNGKFTSSDRGTGEDYYLGTFRYTDTLANVYALEEQLVLNTSSLYGITLEEGEEIFGAEVNTGFIFVTAEEWGIVERTNYNYATIEITLKPEYWSVSKVSVTGTLDNLVYGYQYTAGREVSNNSTVFLDRSGTSSSRAYDTYIFSSTFTLTHEEMQEVRTFIIDDNRGAAFTLPPLPVVEPFGPLVSEPHTVKIVEWEDLGRINKEYWSIKITFVRH